jgi:uncharacterized protein YndB with AHSA1/START domain
VARAAGICNHQVADLEVLMEHVEREVELPSAPEQVWEAVIDPARLGMWLGGELDVTLRPGGRGGFRSPDGAARRVMVLGVEDGHELSFRWWPERDPGAASTVTITVEGRGEGESTVRVRERRAHALLATA